MTDYKLLVKMLKATPGHVYIASDGRTMYMLVGPEEKLMYLHALEKPFSEMTDEEINLTIQKVLTEE